MRYLKKEGLINRQEYDTHLFELVGLVWEYDTQLIEETTPGITQFLEVDLVWEYGTHSLVSWYNIGTCREALFKSSWLDFLA